MKKLFFIIALYAVLCIESGCADEGVQSKLENSDISAISSFQSSSNIVVESPTPNQLPNSTSSSPIISDAPIVSSGQPQISSITEVHGMKKNGKLIVNGKDITDRSYVYISEEGKAVIPLTAVMRELGAIVEWKNNKTVAITYSGDTWVVDTSKLAFGIALPPGESLGVREVVNNEIIIDCSSVRGSIVKWIGAEIDINREEKIIKIG